MTTKAAIHNNKFLKEEFSRFFEQPTREAFRTLLKNNLGELPECDFKRELPQYSKFARHLLGFANSGGGAIVLGVEQKDDNSLEPSGLKKLTDKAEITTGIRKYLPDTMFSQIHILDFSYDATEYNAIKGKMFQVVVVPDDPKHIPFISKSDGEGIRGQAIYIRRGTATEEVTYEEIQTIINRRLETGYSSRLEINLQTHIEQLKILYNQINRFNTSLDLNVFRMSFAEVLKNIPVGKSEPNPKYPQEDFESFIGRIIEKKKKRIEIDLDTLSL